MSVSSITEYKDIDTAFAVKYLVSASEDPVKMTIINFNTATEKMDSQQYPNLSADEMAVVASIKKVGTVWTCKICNQAFETILPLVTHLLTACSDNNTFETSSAMKICMHFDPNDFRGIFEADRRLDPGSADDSTATEEDTSSESDEASTMGSSRDGLESRDSVELDDLDRELLGEDDSDDEQLQAGVKIASAAPVAIERDLSGDETDEDDLESQDSGKTPPAGSEFPATPPPWLSNKDRAEWRTRQDCELILLSSKSNANAAV